MEREREREREREKEIKELVDASITHRFRSGL